MTGLPWQTLGSRTIRSCIALRRVGAPSILGNSRQPTL
jgi:hypothetical protein